MQASREQVEAIADLYCKARTEAGIPGKAAEDWEWAEYELRKHPYEEVLATVKAWLH